MSPSAHQPIRGFPDQALSVEAEIVAEHGRWVLYLNVLFWETGQRAGLNDANPLQAQRHRIADYATRAQAEVAAKWMQRGASREILRPPDGS